MEPPSPAIMRQRPGRAEQAYIPAQNEPQTPGQREHVLRIIEATDTSAVCSGQNRVFKRFPRLNALNILHLENLLVQMEDDLLKADGLASLEKLDVLGTLLKSYNDALIMMKAMEDIPEGHLACAANFEIEKARMLHDPNYVGSADSLTTVDIGPQTSHDGVRRLWQRVLPSQYSYPPGPYHRKMQRLEEARGALTEDLIEALRKEVPTVVSDFVDRTARFSVALIGSVTLMAPMVLLTFIESATIRIGIVASFVLIFSLLMSQLTVSSNQEILAASAAYGAVLVVYIGSAGQMPQSA